MKDLVNLTDIAIMTDITKREFEWDEQKCRSALEKHGVDFRDVIKIFDGQPMVVVQSERKGKERWTGTVGLTD